MGVGAAMTASEGRADPGPTLYNWDTIDPDEYDRALYRIDEHDRARLAETLGRLQLTVAPI